MYHLQIKLEKQFTYCYVLTFTNGTVKTWKLSKSIQLWTRMALSGVYTSAKATDPRIFTVKQMRNETYS